MAFAYIGLTLNFTGNGVDEVGTIEAIDSALFVERMGEECKLSIGQVVVRVDQQYFRPTEVELLIGNPAKSKEVLGWEPEYDLKGLVDDMMMSDIKIMQKESYLAAGGYRTFNYFE